MDNIIPYHFFESLAYLSYFLYLGFLITVLVLSSGGVRAHRWFLLGPFRFQPSELAKLTTIFALAYFLSRRGVVLKSLKDLIIPSIIAAIPCLLIIGPDLGTALVFVPILLAMLYWAGLPFIYLFLIITPMISLICAFSFIAWLIFIFLLVLVLFYFIKQHKHTFDAIFLALINLAIGTIAPFGWEHLKEYRRQRILSFLNPQNDPLGAGYQIIQSKVAIGSGGFWGKGFMNGTQKNLLFLPEQHTDFIFSVIGEEMGFWFCILLLFLFIILLIRIIQAATQIRDRFASLVIIGIATMIFFHILVNIGMTIGVMPITGLPLPFISYGGSSLIMNMLAIGIVLGIRLRQYD